jgi:hypothetical protein
MWHHVSLIRTDVSEEHVALIFRVDTISELGKNNYQTEPHCKEHSKNIKWDPASLSYV